MLNLGCDDVENTNKIRIFYLYESTLIKNSAATTHISELSNNFPKNFEVYCVGPGSDVPLRNHLIILKISTTSRFYILNVMAHILNELLQFGYLLLLSYYYMPKLLLVRHGIKISPYILSKLLDMPVVLEVNGLSTAERNLGKKREVLSRILNISENIALKISKKIISVSGGISWGLANHYNLSLDSFVTIPNGVNTSLFTIADSCICKEKVGLSTCYKYVCFIGNFAPWHGLEYLVRAAPSIVQQVPNTKFILIGDGPTKDFINTIVGGLNLDHVFIFKNDVPYEQVPVYINACDICIILKRKEIPGSPLKLKEYMACGKPVVATKSSDFRILRDHSAGILVDYENIPELSDAVVTLLQNQELCETMGNNGRNYVLNHCSWEDVASRVSTICLDVLNRHHPKIE